MTKVERDIERAFIDGGYQAKKLIVSPSVFAQLAASTEPSLGPKPYTIDVVVDVQEPNWRFSGTH